MDLHAFLSRFNFRSELAGAIGVEREYFLTDDRLMPAPRSPDFLAMTSANPLWTYELSACQVEHRTPPCTDLLELGKELRRAQIMGAQTARGIGLALSAMEVAPEDMPLDIYPHNERYAKIRDRIPLEVLRAGCRVAGVHIHFGARDMAHALDMHNGALQYLEEFCAMGDHSHGERLRLYRTMAPQWKPPHYESVEHFHAVAREQGFEDNPRNAWHLVRISRHGTVELRMFGMTADVAEILDWVQYIQTVLPEPKPIAPSIRPRTLAECMEFRIP